MGMWLDFRCPACGLHGHVSGGPDAGMMGESTTIYCLTCGLLQDATVTTLEADGSLTSVVPRCRRRKTHRIRIWNDEEPCPKCGQALLAPDQDGPVTMWD